MKSLRIIFLFTLTFSIQLAQSQTGTEQPESSNKGRQFYAEIGGPGVIFSANFDSRFKKMSDLGWGYRIGLGFGTSEQYSAAMYSYDGHYYNYYNTSNTVSYITIPVEINYVFGKESSPHSFEVGVGATLLTREIDLYNYDGSYNPGYVIGHTSFMYRKKPTNGGFTWRIGFTPIIGTAGDISPAMAVGLGYAF